MQIEKYLRSDCCGCGTCARVCSQGAITIKKDDFGFEKPYINDELCIDCGKCIRSCNFKKRKKEGIENAACCETFGFKAYGNRLIYQSGGIFSVLAKYLLENGGIVYGISFDNNIAKYTRITCVDEIKLLQGSKYINVSLGKVHELIQSDLENGFMVLLSGSACMLDAIKHFLIQSGTTIDKLYMVDIVCHGVPSGRVFNDYVNYLDKRLGKVINFNFRYKKSGGWEGHIEKIETKKNKYESKNWVRIFYSHLCLNDSCYVCPYASMNRISDITIGDFWGVKEKYPLFYDGDGVSLVITNTDKGKELFSRVKDKGESLSVAPADIIQPNLRRPTPCPDEMECFKKEYLDRGFLETVKEYCGFNENDFLLIQNDLYHKAMMIIEKIMTKIFS